MKADHVPSGPRLDRWLATACWRLAENAKPRVREEITAHYLDGVEHFTSQGIPGADAQRLSLRELGSPRRAWWRLRKVHLTAYEEKTVRRVLSNDRASEQRFFPFATVLLMCTAVPMKALLEPASTVAILAICVLSWLVFLPIFVVFWVKIRRKTGVRKKLLDAMQFKISAAGIVCTVGIQIACNHDHPFSVFGCLMLLGGLCSLLDLHLYARLLQKLQIVSETGDTGRPPAEHRPGKQAR